MNSNQKAQIEKLRASGMGFADMAQQLNLPVTTIKSYCYRHTLPDKSSETPEGVCPQCGQPIPKMRFKPRRFCSDEYGDGRPLSENVLFCPFPWLPDGGAIWFFHLHRYPSFILQFLKARALLSVQEQKYPVLGGRINGYEQVG